MLCLLMTVLAILLPWSAMAQQQKVTIHLSNVKVQEVFKEINKQSGLDFIYSAEQLEQLGLVTLNVQNQTVDSALSRLFTGTGFTYKFTDKTVVVRKETKKAKKVVQQIISGKVRDTEGNPLPGVTVIVNELKMGTSTDQEGKYHITVPLEKNFSLAFSFIGMETKTIKYTGKNTIDVTLNEDVKAIDEVVVTGYQTLKEKGMTGSYSKVKAQDLVMTGNETVEQMLQGKLPGMMVINTSGLTGTRQKVRVRELPR